MNRPIFLLDVDGVINCFPARIPRRDRPAPDALHTFEADGFPINVRLTVVSWLQELAQSGRVDIRWLTTWGHNANHSLVPHLGLPELQVQAEERDWPNLHKSRWWKLEAVKQLAAEQPDRPVIWVDDEISHWRTAIEFIGHRHEKDISLLLGLSPDEDRGLSDLHMELIDRFLAMREEQRESA